MHYGILDLTYYATGIIGAFLGLLVAYVFATKDVNFVKSRIFLKYHTFKWGFLILIFGIIFFAVTNIMAIIDMEIFHEVGEIIYNISIIIFITVIFMILNPMRKGIKSIEVSKWKE